jgi:hypothetical protein
VAVAAAGDSPGEEQAADAGGATPGQVAVLTARAAELNARAEELTARAEELTSRLEGLTTKIDELQGKLDTTGATLSALPALVPSPTPTASQTVARNGQGTTGTRSPWVMSPLPEPGSRVTAGPLVLETRARGEAPITQIRLQLDGIPVSVSLEKRDDLTWRGRASASVRPGAHTVAVAVVDSQGRTGSYKWQFNASPS